MSLPPRIIRVAGLGCHRWLLAFCLAGWLQPQAGVATTLESGPPAIGPASPADFTPTVRPPSLETNSIVRAGGGPVENFNTLLATARYLEKTGQPNLAEPILVGLLAEKVPDSIRRAALFELGAVVRMENDLPSAVSICAQFLDRWADDPRTPEQGSSECYYLCMFADQSIFPWNLSEIRQGSFLRR